MDLLSHLARPGRTRILGSLELDEPSVRDALDRLTELVRDVLDVPVALVSLVDENRQYFPGCVGLPEPWRERRETPLSHSFCQHVVHTEEPLVIEDAREDPLVRDNLAIRDLNVIAYLGIPLTTKEGEVLGSFCAIDHTPRSWTEQEITVMRTLAGSVMAQIELQRELAERRAAEEARDRIERRLQTLVQEVRDWVWEIDATGAFTSVSPSATDLTGYERHEILGRTTADFMDREEADRFARALDPFLGQGLPFRDIEKSVRRKDGSELVLSASGVPLRDEEGKVVGYHGFSRDVTARRKAEEVARELAREQAARAAAQESEQRITALVEGMGQAFLAVDRSGVLTYVNGRASEFLEADRDELVGERLVEALGWLGGTRLAEEGLRLQEDPERGKTVEIVERVPDMGAWLRAVIHSTLEGLVIFVRDVTEEMETREELEEKEEQLRQSQKMEAVGLLAGGIAHDFNNLLTAIMGNTELALEEEGLGEELKVELAEIRSAADQAKALTRQLLTFSRKEVRNPQVIDLNAVVGGAERMLSRIVGERHPLRSELEEGLPSVCADFGQMEQVLMNLVVNARDAMTEGGRITLATRSETLARPRSVLSGRLPAGEQVVLSVADQGVGMERSTLLRIFEPFFTTKPQGQGTGLGLSTVHGIVKQSGGEIDVESAPGAGTVFRIYLPRHEAPAEERRPAPPQGRSIQGDEEARVLVVEDEAAVRSVARRVLERAGYDVLEAESGEEALAVLEAEEEEVDVLLTDLVMPGMGGWELAGRVRERSPRTRVLVTSGYTPDEGGLEGADIPEESFLQKPYSATELVEAVRGSRRHGTASARP